MHKFDPARLQQELRELLADRDKTEAELLAVHRSKNPKAADVQRLEKRLRTVGGNIASVKELIRRADETGGKADTLEH